MCIRDRPEAWCSLRPEAIRVVAGNGQVTGTAGASRYLGAGTKLAVHLGRGDDMEITVVLPPGQEVPAPGTTVALQPLAGALHVMAGEK